VSGGFVEAAVGIAPCVTPLAGMFVRDGGTVKAAWIAGEKNAETVPTSTSRPIKTHPMVISRCTFLINKIPFLIFLHFIHQELDV